MGTLDVREHVLAMLSLHWHHQAVLFLLQLIDSLLSAHSLVTAFSTLRVVPFFLLFSSLHLHKESLLILSRSANVGLSVSDSAGQADLLDYDMPMSVCSPDGAVLVCLRSIIEEREPHGPTPMSGYDIRLFDMRTGKHSRSYILTLSCSDELLTCPCVDEADGSIWVMGTCWRWRGDNKTEGFLYKLVFDDNMLTATTLLSSIAYPQSRSIEWIHDVVWTSVKKGHFRPISSSPEWCLYETRPSDKQFTKFLLAFVNPEQGDLLSTAMLSIQEHNESYEWNGRIYFYISVYYFWSPS